MSILLAIETPNYKPAKFSVPKFSSITFNKFTVKDSFAFAEEIVHQRVNFSWVDLRLIHSSLICLLKKPSIFVTVC